MHCRKVKGKFSVGVEEVNTIGINFTYTNENPALTSVGSIALVRSDSVNLINH